MAEDKRIPELPLRSVLVPGMILAVYDPNTDVTYRMEVAQAIPAPAVIIPEWQEGAKYAAGRDVKIFNTEDGMWSVFTRTSEPLPGGAPYPSPLTDTGVYYVPWAGGVDLGEYTINGRDIRGGGATPRRALSSQTRLLEINYGTDHQDGVKIWGPVYISDLRTSQPAPEGVELTAVSPEPVPVINGAAVTIPVGVAEVTKEGNVYPVAALDLVTNLSTAGKSRVVLVAIDTAADAPLVFKLLEGAEAATGKPLVDPTLLINHLQVHRIVISDNQAFSSGGWVKTVNGKSPDSNGNINLTITEKVFSVSYTVPNREYLDYFKNAAAIKAIRLGSGVASFSYSVDGGVSYITPVLPLSANIAIPANTEMRYRITYAPEAVIGNVFFELI